MKCYEYTEKTCSTLILLRCLPWLQFHAEGYGPKDITCKFLEINNAHAFHCVQVRVV